MKATNESEIERLLNKLAVTPIIALIGTGILAPLIAAMGVLLK